MKNKSQPTPFLKHTHHADHIQSMDVTPKAESPFFNTHPQTAFFNPTIQPKANANPPASTPANASKTEHKTGLPDNLKWGVQDRIHQPQRGNKLYKYLFPMIEAAEKAGASCAYLSGAGPTVMAITSGASGDIFAQREKERSDLAVARAMISAAEKFGISGKMLVTSASIEGARVVKVSPPFSTDNISFRDEI